MYEGTLEQIIKNNDEWGEYRLLRAKKNEIDVDNRKDKDQFEFNKQF